MLTSGYQALSEYSMLNPPAVCSFATDSIVMWENLASKSLQNSEEQYAVELWRYDPKKLAIDEYVDRLSLALSLRDDRDERIEEAVDEMLTQVWKDIDLVLIVEALDVSFGKRFWKYILSAGYEHRSRSTGEPQFYRFTNPVSRDYPAMIELFTRKTDTIILPDDAVLSPLPLDDDVSSLSAILLDTDYYNLVQRNHSVSDSF